MHAPSPVAIKFSMPLAFGTKTDLAFPDPDDDARAPKRAQHRRRPRPGRANDTGRSASVAAGAERFLRLWTIGEEPAFAASTPTRKAWLA